MSYWQPGHKLNKGKFVVEQLLGSGGFGVTYLVKQTRNGKLFALKTLNELARNRADFQQLQAKFINEAIALASCRHPHIVQVYPQGFQARELWCMVMEYVEGEDLNGKYTYQNEPKGEYRHKTTPVGKFHPNAFGLYDMHGNVWEWCGYSEPKNYPGSFDNNIPSISTADNINVLRGGSWGSRPEFCRSAHRDQFIAEKSDNFIGLRCVITDALS